ncbi:asparagine synthase (glutamine-hydrolyzing) [Persephonella sp.]
MCGIIGWITKNQISEKILEQMNNSISHRGPDDSGIYIDKDKKIGLAHRRLSIIDPEHGKQPMSDESKKIWIVFNGAIYNYLELRRELIQYGYPIKTFSDTEVIIYSYIHWKEKCLEKFNGMFAFLIYDSERKILFGARDRIGIKPLYYYMDKDNIIFASEVKAILKAGLITPELDQNGLMDYLTFQYYLKDKTLFKNIKTVMPGHYFIIYLNKSNLNLRINEYWDIVVNPEYDKDESYFIDIIKFYLEDSIKIRLRADVPIGSHLSGGLDSSTVSTLASYMLNGFQLKTFTGKFSEGKEFDESYYAKLVANNINADYNEIDIKPNDFLDHFEDIVYFMDYPQAGPGVFPQYMVSKFAKQKVKVILGGQGGDELFIGYTRYLIVYLEQLIKESILENKEAIRKLKSLIEKLYQLNGYQPMMKQFFSNGLFDIPEKRYFQIINRMESMKNIISKDVLNTNYSTFNEFDSIFNKYSEADIIDKISYYEMKTSLVSLLHVEDRTSMAAGLESRVPILDYRIVENVFRIPSHIKLKDGELKYLFKQVIKHYLPHEIVARRDKKGFPTPLNRWMKKDLNSWIKDILSDKRTLERGIFDRKFIEKLVESSSEYSRNLWGVLNLELWFRNFIDRKP